MFPAATPGLILSLKRRTASAAVLMACGCLSLTACRRSDPIPEPAADSTVTVRDSLPQPQNSDSAVSNGASSPRRYALEMASSDVDALENDPFSNSTHPAIFKADGNAFPVKIRVRGSWSRSWPKKSFKIVFNHDQPFERQHCLNLNSGWRDPAFVREPLAYHVFAVCGAPAPFAAMVRLDINGKFAGLFVQIEQPEKQFLKRVGLPGASVYKASSRNQDADERDLGGEEAYRSCYDKETHKTEGYQELQQFCHELARNPAQGFFEQNLQVEKYINFLAANVLVQNWDGFNKNHFLVYDAKGSHKWLVVPWDLDRTFGDHWNMSFSEARLPVLLGTRRLPGVTGWNRLQDRFLAEPALRARFLQRLAELLNTEFTEDKLFPLLDQMEKQIASDATRDRRQWPGASSNVHSGIQQVKAFIRERRSYLKREIVKLQTGEATQASR